MFLREQRERGSQGIVVAQHWFGRDHSLNRSFFVLVRLKAFGFASRGNREVPNSRIKKRLKLGRQPEAGKLPYEIEKRFLEDVEGQFAVAGEPIGQAHDPVAVPVI